MAKNNVEYFTNRSQWRQWIEENFDKKEEVWLIYPKKSTGKSRIPYNDAVEEALCFGWIDSINKSLDENHTMQRFTPRKPGSSFSQPNKERLKWLLEKDMIHRDLKHEVETIIREKFHFPEDILEEIKKDDLAWANYQAFSDGYKRIRIAYINSARNRPDEFEKRLRNFIRKTQENNLIRGYGGIEKYY